MSGKRYIPRDLPKGAKLAFDVNVPNIVIGKYAREGHPIVCCCNQGETDESFVDRAYVAGATHILSQDADIGIIIDKEGYDMIWELYYE